MDKCKGKKLYDTEFEAEISASKTSAEFGRAMVHYAHGSHWHIANKEIRFQGKHNKPDLGEVLRNDQ